MNTSPYKIPMFEIGGGGGMLLQEEHQNACHLFGEKILLAVLIFVCVCGYSASNIDWLVWLIAWSIHLDEGREVISLAGT